MAQRVVERRAAQPPVGIGIPGHRQVGRPPHFRGCGRVRFMAVYVFGDIMGCLSSIMVYGSDHRALVSVVQANRDILRGTAGNECDLVDDARGGSAPAPVYSPAGSRGRFSTSDDSHESEILRPCEPFG